LYCVCGAGLGGQDHTDLKKKKLLPPWEPVGERKPPNNSPSQSEGKDVAVICGSTIGETDQEWSKTAVATRTLGSSTS